MAIKLALKVAILATGKTQRQIAAAANLSENKLSEIVRGWTQPRADEGDTLARVLNRPVSELFGDEASAKTRQPAGAVA